MKMAFGTMGNCLFLMIMAVLCPAGLLAQTDQHPSGGASLPTNESRLMWVDLHYHWEGHANLDEMIRLSRSQGIILGVTGEGGASWGLSNDQKLEQFVNSLQGKPVYKGLQVYGMDWRKRYSERILALLDYIAADALLFPDKGGRPVALWNPKVSFPDAEEFMERYVAYNLKVLGQPINIWSNPTYLPLSLQPRYEQLWTQERMLKVIRAAARNHIAVEINSKYNIPSLSFLKLAKRAGCRFSLGSNRHDDEPGDLVYSIRMAKELGLTPQNIFVPARKPNGSL